MITGNDAFFISVISIYMQLKVYIDDTFQVIIIIQYQSSDI